MEKTRLVKDGALSKLNIELGNAKPAGKYKEVATPNQKTIEEVSKFLKIRPANLIKTLIYKVTAEGEKPVFVAVLVRGDHEVVDAKLSSALFDGSVVKTRDIALEFADEADVRKITGAATGFAGPIGLKGKIAGVLADAAVFGDESFVVGANKNDLHLTSVSWADCGIGRLADIRRAVDGDKCPNCSGGTLLERRGIEVGQVFYLGTKYSEKMHAVYLDEGGKEKAMVMGCYGIGIGRTAAAAIEQNHDDKGIIWPLPIAPFHVEVISIGNDEKTVKMAEKVYGELVEAGIEVLYDDRNERPGVKFADADLIGIPYHAIIGKKAVEDGKIEFKVRKTGERNMLSIEEVIKKVVQR